MTLSCDPSMLHAIHVTRSPCQDGFEELIPDDQARVRRAFADGHVAAEDIPDSARHNPKQLDDADQAAAAAAVLPPAPPAPAESQPKKKRG